MSPAKKPTLPVDIYVRVSRVGGRDGASFQSPEQQEARCRAQLKADDLTAGEVFVDLDQSGSKASRPAFDQAMERIGDGISGGLIVHDLSRFGRDVRNILDGIDMIEARGAVFISCAEKLDTSTSSGRFVLTMFAALRELEREQMKERWVVSRTGAVTAGIHVSRHTPPGYTRDPSRRLVPDGENAETVRDAFRMAARGDSYMTIATFLTERGLPIAGETARWQSGRIKKLLANRAYLGEARSGTLVNPGAHAALVDEVTFVLAQHNNPATYAPTISLKANTLLAGICRCASCRYALRSQPPSGRQKGPIYRCAKRSTAGACTGPAGVSAPKLEAYVLDAFLAHIPDVQLEPVIDDEERVEAAQAALEAEGLYRAWLTNTEMQAALGADYDARLLALKAAWDDALASIPEAQASAAGSTGGTNIRALVEELRQRGDNESIESLRELLSTQIQAVFVKPSPTRIRGQEITPDRVHIVWADEEPVEVPRRGTQFAPTPYTWE